MCQMNSNLGWDVLTRLAYSLYIIFKILHKTLLIYLINGFNKFKISKKFFKSKPEPFLPSSLFFHFSLLFFKSPSFSLSLPYFLSYSPSSIFHFIWGVLKSFWTDLKGSELPSAMKFICSSKYISQMKGENPTTWTVVWFPNHIGVIISSTVKDHAQKLSLDHWKFCKINLKASTWFCFCLAFRHFGSHLILHTQVFMYYKAAMSSGNL